MNMPLKYSFGGTREEPLVQRTVQYRFEDYREDMPDLESKLQEALLERTELLLADLCTVFDNALAACVASDYKDTVQVETMMGACFYAVRNVLLQSPSAQYALFFSRVQTLLNLRPQLVLTMGEDAVDTLSGFVLQIWEDLKKIDATFAAKPEIRVPDLDVDML
jgi:hypothetical protein